MSSHVTDDIFFTRAKERISLYLTELVFFLRFFAFLFIYLLFIRSGPGREWEAALEQLAAGDMGKAEGGREGCWEFVRLGSMGRAFVHLGTSLPRVIYLCQVVSRNKK